MPRYKSKVILPDGWAPEVIIDETEMEVILPAIMTVPYDESAPDSPPSFSHITQEKPSIVSSELIRSLLSTVPKES